MSIWETRERQALREMVTTFTEKEIAPHLSLWEDANEVPRELHKKASDAGLMGVAFPEEVGGQGGDLIDSTIVTESILEAGGSTGLIAALFTHGIALPHIVASGTRPDASPEARDLIDRYVRPTLAGDMIGSLGVTEPGAGSDVANIRTKAVRDGDEFVVNGAKTFITSGVRADFVTTAVRTGGDGYPGISLLVIDKNTPGFTVARPLRKMGWHCSDTAELSFDNVRVPATNIVGEVDGGFVLIMQQFVNERLGLAVQAYSTAQRALDLAVAYARERETFGRPLIQRQVIRHKLVDMHRKTAAARALTRLAIEKAVANSVHSAGGAGGSAATEGTPGPILEAVLAKNQSVEACEWVVSEAVQIHGGMGYMRESEIDRHYRDARILGIGGGATEVLNDLAAKLLGF
ncbi:MAG: acyl-CoA dehydrogenase family protein [Actinomycetota bacterium]|nr:acyl-CoA dehydrogenase family protein [Actinomycetota bacterium]